MTITKVDVMKFERKIVGVRIYTDNGLYGDGEAALTFGVGHLGAYGVLQELATKIIGMDPLDHEVIWDKLYKHTFWAQNGGPIIFSGISAIDLALWDIKGKYFNVPVYKLLGGKRREKLRAYASQLQFSWNRGINTIEDYYKRENMACTTEDYVRFAKDAIAEGFDAIKFDFFEYDKDGRLFGDDDRLGILRPYYVKLIRERLSAVRDAVGDDVDIIMENHSYIDSTAALQLAEIGKEYNVFAFEEPCTPTPKMTEFIQKSTGLRIAQGERIYSRWGYAPYFENNSVQLIQPDLGNTGGITEGKKICDMAYVYDVGVQCHVCSSGLSISPALHLECVIPNFVIHEHHMCNLQDYAIKLAKYNYQPVNGYFEIPELPGLGNEWSEYAIKHCEKVEIT